MVGAVQEGTHTHGGRAASGNRTGRSSPSRPARVPTPDDGRGVAPAVASASWCRARSGGLRRRRRASDAGEPTKFVGRSTGSGQCVALAKAVQPALGSTAQWRGGEKVQGNTDLQPGTVIAHLQPGKPIRERAGRQQPCRGLLRAERDGGAGARPMGGKPGGDTDHPVAQSRRSRGQHRQRLPSSQIRMNGINRLVYVRPGAWLE